MRFSSLPFDSQPSFRSFPSDEQRWSRGWLCFGGSHPAAPQPCSTLTPQGAPTPWPGSWHRHAAGGRRAVPGEGGCRGVVKPTQAPVRLSRLLGLVSDNISTGRCERSAAGNQEPQICGEWGPGSPRGAVLAAALVCLASQHSSFPGLCGPRVCIWEARKVVSGMRKHSVIL